MPRPLVNTFEDPDNFKNGDQTDKTWVLFRQAIFNNLRCAWGLLRIVLRDVAQKDVCIESNHSLPRNRCVAPASIAPSISSRGTGLSSLGIIPFSRAVGILGRMITPSGWKKNLNRSPDFICRRSRTIFGIVACPLLLRVASIPR